MRPLFWHPPVELSPLEQSIIVRVKRAKLFVFLRSYRNALFDDTFQAELAALYAPSLRGHPPIPPAQLALATILQAYTGVSDDEATLMDRRWQARVGLPGYRAGTVQQRNIRRLSQTSHRRPDGSSAH